MARKALERTHEAPAESETSRGDDPSNAQRRGQGWAWTGPVCEKEVRVALVHPDPALHETLRAVLTSVRASWRLESYCSSMQALAILPDSPPDVVLLQEEGTASANWNYTRILKVALPSVPLLVLSACQDKNSIFLSLALGASGHLVTPIEPVALPGAIEKAVRGEVALCPRAERVVAACLGLRDVRLAAPVRAPGGQVLTPREEEVVACLEEGLQDKEIAARLGMQVRTVNAHKTRIFTKLDTHSSSEAVRNYRLLRQGRRAA